MAVSGRDKDAFYVICPSDSSMEFYPTNTLANFKMKLQTPLELDGDYEVGLCEIHYTKSWNNVRKNNNTFLMRFRLPGADGRLSKPYVSRKIVPPGYYQTVQSLIKVVNELVAPHPIGNLKGFLIDYNEITRRVVITTKDQLFKQSKDGKAVRVRGSIKFRGDIANIFGFGVDTLIKANTTLTSPHAAMPSGGFTHMLVYCDLVESLAIGHHRAPCLRVLPVATKPDESNIGKSFANVFYLPVARKFINTIEFKIADSEGIPVGFDHGKVVIVLHFRRRRAR